jgi:hypothetical protein
MIVNLTSYLAFEWTWAYQGESIEESSSTPGTILKGLIYGSFNLSFWIFVSRYWVSSIKMKLAIKGIPEPLSTTNCYKSVYILFAVLNGLFPGLIAFTTLLFNDKQKEAIFVDSCTLVGDVLLFITIGFMYYTLFQLF